MSDQVHNRIESREESASPFNAAQIYSTMDDMGRQFQYQYRSQADVSTIVGGLELTNNQYGGPPRNRSEQVRQQADNARDQLPGLMEMSGANAEGRYGLTKAHLDKLQTMQLTPAQQDAVRFLQKNFSELSTNRFGGTGLDDWDPFADSAITPSSINRYQYKAEPVEGSPRREGKGDRGSRPYDPANDRDDRPEVGSRKTGLGDRQRDDIVVKEGWGWWQIARESLRRQGIHEDLDGSRTRAEMDRIRQRNPGVDMLRPNQRIRV